MIKGLWLHFKLTMGLNCRSGRTLAYGYLVPVLFLLGFGSIFRGGQPLLLDQMGQILTITILGGACLGMPTALVAEREQGLWRRFELLPIPVNALLSSVLLARLCIVALAVILQMVLAHYLYGTPYPLHPGQFLLAYAIVIFPFLGLGLIVTALASDVPSVQALGQCLFLPMILIGGVGVPLVLLPEWAQILASFMPGRYAVEVLQATYHEGQGLAEVPFSIIALLTIGLASTVAGLGLIRWEGARRLTARSSMWVVIALLTWAGTGATALWMDRTEPLAFYGTSTYREIPREAIDQIRFDGLPEDDGIYTPLAPPLGNMPLSHRMRELLPRLANWEPGLRGDKGQRVRNLISVAAIADITQDNAERIIARIIYDHLREHFAEEDLIQALAWVALDREAGSVITAAPELGLRGEVHPSILRERSDWYARKYLGRILGVIEDP